MIEDVILILDLRSRVGFDLLYKKKIKRLVGDQVKKYIIIGERKPRAKKPCAKLCFDFMYKAASPTKRVL